MNADVVLILELETYMKRIKLSNDEQMVLLSEFITHWSFF